MQRKSLTCIRDDKTSEMPISLEIAVGSIAQCTKNVSNHFKLVNGSIGTVVAITPAQNDDIRVRVADGVEEHQHSLPPEVVFIRLKDSSDRSFHPELPLGVVPICQRYERGISVKLPDRQFSVCIRQVPLVLAYPLTTEKCHGLTVDRMVLAPLRHPTRYSPQRSSCYVTLLTRVKTLRQLYLMVPLTKQFLEYFIQDELQESLRLQAMEV
ncbi:unnamed protein product [Phytophthora fragariaefolia]|uniref:Unnamed protein product n=1 Tax=Phytophthora fragariaefolia TaxID=1490495 RepID=A0A9W6YFL3_9STRA|nr:unnamed protein product [Phytophthora fragariaefolia]